MFLWLCIRGFWIFSWLLASPLLTADSVVNGYSVASSVMETHMSVCTDSIYMAQITLFRDSDWFLLFLWLFIGSCCISEGASGPIKPESFEVGII